MSEAGAGYHVICRRVPGDTRTVRRTSAFVREAVELSRDGSSTRASPSRPPYSN